MFIVLTYTAEYLEAIAPRDAALAAGDKAAYTAYLASYEATEAIPHYRCCGIFETEAKARAYIDLGPETRRELAYLFPADDTVPGNRFILYPGHNGWELAASSPGVAFGPFADASAARHWSSFYGMDAEQIVELEPALAERLAA